MKILLHIPKTAGVSIREILSARLKSNEICHIADPAIITPGFRVSSTTKLVHGHIDISHAERLSESPQLYTFLRDPLRRAISEYYFIKGGNYAFEDLPSEQVEVLNAVKSLTLEEYLLSDRRGVRGRVQNSQLFYLSGDVFNADFSLEQRYEKACKTIDGAVFVGIVEEMSASVALLCLTEGLPPLTAVVRNSSEGSKALVSDEVVSRFKARNEYDYRIYAYARKRMLNDYDARFRELALEVYFRKLEALPMLERLSYSFDMPLEGDNWHTRETNGSIFWRFTGPGDKSSIYFPRLSRGVRTVVFQVYHAVTVEHLSALQVRLNGVPLPRGEFDGMKMSFHIPVEALEGAHTCIEIVTPPAQRPEANDDRELGVAFSAIEIS